MQLTGQLQVFVRTVHVSHGFFISSLEEVKEQDTKTLETLAAKFNLSYNAFGEDITDSGHAYGKLALSDAFHAGLQPAPITPTGEDAAAYQLLSGTIKATYDAHRGGDEVIVSPGIMSGNTGKWWLQNLSVFGVFIIVAVF